MPYSFLNLAEEVLQTAEQPMTFQEIWEIAVEKKLQTKLRSSTGKTPWQTLGARLYVDVRDNPSSLISKVGSRPSRFFLKSRQNEVSPTTVNKLEKEQNKKRIKEPTSYKERDLHPLLAYFAYSNPAFNHGKSIFSKTIFHESSKKGGYNEWIHPDMVGFYIPLEDWRPEVIEFNRLSDNNSIHLYSFELKKELSKANYREAYFQAVSNSSWAHEGYLVAAKILQDDDFLAELERLAASFSIGIIHLDVHDVDSSTVLYPAKVKDKLDWETINKLCDQNPDFLKFIEDVKIDFNYTRIHKSEYDEIITEPDDYVRQKFHNKL